MKSSLYNEDTFYQRFISDLENAKAEVIIESPYLTVKRVSRLKQIFETLITKGVEIIILTKAPSEHDKVMAEQSEVCIQYFEQVGIQVLLVQGGHHRKLAMIDRCISWEGSLNILSQIKSRELMRRIENRSLVQELFQFLRFDQLNI